MGTKRFFRLHFTKIKKSLRYILYFLALSKITLVSHFEIYIAR